MAIASDSKIAADGKRYDQDDDTAPTDSDAQHRRNVRVPVSVAAGEVLVSSGGGFTAEARYPAGLRVSTDEPDDADLEDGMVWIDPTDPLVPVASVYDTDAWVTLEPGA